MTNQNNAAQAAVNTIIAQHFSDDPAGAARALIVVNQVLSALRAPVADRQRLRELVDVVWNEATESTAVPDTQWADRLIDKVFPAGSASAPVAGEAVAWMRKDGGDCWTAANKRAINASGGIPGRLVAAEYSIPLTYAAPQASEAVQPDQPDIDTLRRVGAAHDAVEVCPECDIAGCRHIRDRAALSAQPGAQTQQIRYGTNSGHGHAWERPDGVKARCGGPGLCSECSADKAHADRVTGQQQKGERDGSR